MGESVADRLARQGEVVSVVDIPRGWYTYQEGDTCEACLQTDMLDLDPETGGISHLIEIVTATCARCREKLRRCERCDIDNNPHDRACEAPEDE